VANPAKQISLALQGGGAHGAFTWGVIDRLLEDGRVEIRAATGASAGAMNAVVLAAGLQEGGPAAAREKLEAFWRGVNAVGGRNIFGDIGAWSRAFDAPDWLKATPGWQMAQGFAAAFSPYDFNPLNLNPLHDVLEEQVNFAALRKSSPIALYVSATGVQSGKSRVFRTDELTGRHVMASACLPHLFQAVTIDGEAYWDGGYAGNPPITPLVRECDSNDTILVPVNPIERPGIPRSAREIIDRVNEVSFNASLLKELRMIAVLRRVVNPGDQEGARWAGMRMHMIASETVARLGVSSKSNTEWEFFCFLREEGRRRADEFLAAHADDLGHRSTVDIEKLLTD
jgi:NTE family protein